MKIHVNALHRAVSCAGVITLKLCELSCSGVGFFYNTSLQVPSCFFTFFHFNPTTFPFLNAPATLQSTLKVPGESLSEGELI